MFKLHGSLITVMIVSLSAVNATAAEIYQPLPPIANPRMATGTLALANLSPECETPPTLDTVRQGLFRTRTYVVSTDIAAHLGNVFRVFKADGNTNRKVLIHETTQSSDCLANDGETQLEYGYAFRVAFSISQADASGELTIPALAASATLSRKEGEIVAGLWGINDDNARSLVAKFASLDLGVETFAEVRQTLDGAVASVSTANTETLFVTRLGALNVPASNAIEIAVATTYALKQLSRRLSCNDSLANTDKLSFKTQIAEIYTQIQGSCTGTRPTSSTASDANALIRGYF